MTTKKSAKKTVTKSEDKYIDVPGTIQDLPDVTVPKNGDVVVIEKDNDKTGTAVVVQNPEREAVLSIVGGVTTPELTKALEVQTEQRKLIQKFIKDNLVESVDYGKIHVIKTCPAEQKQRGSCDIDYHFSKSILFKPGQEKIFSLFGITDELVKDVDAYEMLQDVSGLVAYKCIMHRGDKRIGEGRGAATLSGSQGDPNGTIKKAEKRARMDACLSLGFSAYFTQDLDDPEYASQREMMNSKAAAEADRRDRDEFGLMPRDPDEAIDNEERRTLQRIILKNGFTDPDEILELLKTNGIPDPHSMTSGQAREMMSKLSNSMFSTPTRSEKAPDEVVNDVPDTITAEDLPDIEQDPEETTPAAPDDPELVVDEDLKDYIIENVENMGLTGRGQMWLYQKICGRPFAKWDKMTDKEWRRGYEVIQGMLDGTYDVPDEYIRGLVKDAPPAKDFSEPTKNQPGDLVQATFPAAEVMNAEEQSEVKPDDL